MQRKGLHGPSGQPILELQHPRSKDFIILIFSHVQVEPPRFQLTPVAASTVAGLQRNVGSASHLPYSVLGKHQSHLRQPNRTETVYYGSALLVSAQKTQPDRSGKQTSPPSNCGTVMTFLCLLGFSFK